MARTSDYSILTSDEVVARFARRRAAIDMIGSIRVRNARVSLFATSLFRTNPNGPEPQATRDAWIAVLDQELIEMQQICDLLTGHDPSCQTCGTVCACISDHAARQPETVKAFQRALALAKHMVTAIKSDDLIAMEKAVEAQKAFGRGGFYDVATEFCDGLWAHLDARRHSEIDRAKATTKTIADTLVRLDHIGKHVRLVSINASVEAARVGDAGRGLGVIAVEFKTLAEEIRRLATTARTDIASMLDEADDMDEKCPPTGPNFPVIARN